MKPSAGNFVTMNINERMALSFFNVSVHVMLDSVPPCYVADFELSFITFLNHETI
jgi:hypothetical protein